VQAGEVGLAPTPHPALTPALSPRREVSIGGPGPLRSFNPLLADDEGTRAISRLLFDSLLSVDPDTGALRPGLAESWLVSPDSRTITFTLRTSPRWHDGEALTAKDAAFTMELARQLAPQTPHLVEFSAIAATASPDTHTLVVTLRQPACTLLYPLGLLPILPGHLLAGSNAITDSFNSAPIGSGPFMYRAGSPGQGIIVARNPSYWGSRPSLDSLSYQVFTDTQTLADAVAAGRVDVASLPRDTAVSLPDNPDLNRYPYPTQEYFFIAFNNAVTVTNHFILSDRRVRQALSLALDRRHILEQVVAGEGVLLSGPFLPGYWAVDTGEARLAPPTQPPPYDPEQARALLAEAGWSDSDNDGVLDKAGVPLRFIIHANGENRTREEIAILAQQYYRAIGVDATVGTAEYGNFLYYIFEHDFDALVFSWPLGLEPDQSQFWRSDKNAIGSGFNFVSYSNSQVDALLDEAAGLPGCSPGARAQRYGKVASILAEDRPYDFLFAPNAYLVARSRVAGIAPSPFAGPYWNVGDWYIRD
jgi:peptide/nickel transport system substrate-binding protein